MQEEVKWKAINTGYCTSFECFALKGGKFRTIHFPAICILIHHKIHGNILFDTGYSPHYFTATKRWPFIIYRKLLKVVHNEKKSAKTQLELLGIPPKEINTIILSHLHADHYAGIKDFPNASFILHKFAYQSVKNISSWGALKKAFLPDMLPENFNSRVQLLESKDFSSPILDHFPFQGSFDVFKDSSCLLVELPGHACGQIGMLINNKDFFVVDASWIAKGIEKNICPPSWILSLMDDPKAYRNTLMKLHQCFLKFPNISFFPTHDNSLYD